MTPTSRGSSSRIGQTIRIFRSMIGATITSAASGVPGLLRKALGIVTGFGGRTFVRRAIDKLKDNIERGDTTIDVVGFSRGAALALDFVNEIAKGKAKLEDGTIPKVRFLGLFDCVPSFGVPISPLNIGWDLDLPSNVEKMFSRARVGRAAWQLPSAPAESCLVAGRLTEVWFRGVHSDVGGNGEKEDPPRGLSSIALNWMATNAQACGLQFDQELVAETGHWHAPRPGCSTTSIRSKRRSASSRTATWCIDTVTVRDACNNPGNNVRAGV